MQQFDPNQITQPPGPPMPPQPARQPQTDVMAPIGDALNTIDPEQAYLVDSFGGTIRKRGELDALMKAALTGETTGSLRGQVQAAQAAESAMSGAEESMDVDDGVFERLMQQLEGETGRMPEVPTRGAFQQPSHLEQGLAALMSIGTPEHAFDIGQAPYNVSQMRREEQYGYAQDRYKSDLQRREDRIGLLKTKLSEQTKRDIAKAERLAKAGDKKAQAIQNAIGRMLQANRPGEARIAWMELPAEERAKYKDLVDTIEKDAKAKFDNDQASTQAMIQQREAATRMKEFQLQKAEMLLPFDLKSAQDKQTLDGLKIQLQQSAVKLIPQQEELMGLRVEMGRMKNLYYPQEVAWKAQMAEFQMGMAAANFDLAVQNYQRLGDQFSYSQAEIAKSNQRIAIQAVMDATEQERQYAIKERDNNEEGSEGYKKWDAYKGRLEVRKSELANELKAVSGTMGQGLPQGGGGSLGRPDVPQIDVGNLRLPAIDNGGLSGPIGGGGNFGGNDRRPPGGSGGNTQKKKKEKKKPSAADTAYNAAGAALSAAGFPMSQAFGKKNKSGPKLPAGWTGG